MPQPHQKDWIDTAIDFFFGAAFGDLIVAFGFFRAAGRQINIQWQWSTFCIVIFATTAIAGSLAALYRNQFWSGYDTYSVIPPIEETVSNRIRIILRTILALGFLSLGLLFIW